MGKEIEVKDGKVYVHDKIDRLQGTGTDLWLEKWVGSVHWLRDESFDGPLFYPGDDKMKIMSVDEKRVFCETGEGMVRRGAEEWISIVKVTGHALA